MTETLSVLQIGCGQWGQNHLRIWSDLGLDIYAVDKDPTVLKNAERYNIQGTSADVDQFLSKADIVDVVTSTESHHQLCKKAIQKGIDTFVEKPMTMTSDQAKDLLNALAGTDIILTIGHIFRFNPSVSYIKEQLDKSRLGKIRYLFAHFMGFKRMRNDVGITQTDSIHYFDLISYFLGKWPQQVTAVTRDFVNNGRDNFSTVILDYDGTLAQIEASYFPPGKWRDLTVIGDKATIVCDVQAQSVELYKNRHELIQGTWTAINEGIEKPAIVTKEPLLVELKHFIGCVKTRQPPLVRPEDGYNTLRVVESAYLSSKQGKTVAITY